VNKLLKYPNISNDLDSTHNKLALLCQSFGQANTSHFLKNKSSCRANISNMYINTTIRYENVLKIQEISIVFDY